MPVNDPATMIARGADPLITIPAGAGHLFRRITGLVLTPLPGALVPLPTCLPQSVMELVLGPTVNTGVTLGIGALPALLEKVLPSKFDQALTQLEAEPAGIGLVPGANYISLDDAVSAVVMAMRRVRAQP